eukprot:GHVU01126972.1.p1 GENE.GHVU01126972.1~~GHVU01126972.1.p1  ORF type:complete len:118 (+),score=2.39 GHVU01126972.1:268-621(+)
MWWQADRWTTDDGHGDAGVAGCVVLVQTRVWAIDEDTISYLCLSLFLNRVGQLGHTVVLVAAAALAWPSSLAMGLPCFPSKSFKAMDFSVEYTSTQQLRTSGESQPQSVFVHFKRAS